MIPQLKWKMHKSQVKHAIPSEFATVIAKPGKCGVTHVRFRDFTEVCVIVERAHQRMALLTDACNLNLRCQSLNLPAVQFSQRD